MRTKPSPYSPKPTPGDTATLARSSSSFEKARLPMPRYSAGTGAQANIDAAGGGTSPQAGEQRVAPRPVALANLGDAVLRPVERPGRRHLDRREGAIVEIGFDPRQ